MRSAVIALLALSLVACGGEPRVRVATKNFTEQYILGEIVAQHLEHRLGGHISRRFGLGGTLLTHQAMVAGEIDVYPEYTGTALTAVLKEKPVNDPARALAIVRRGYAPLGLEWLEPFGFENTFAMVIRNAEGINTISDAARAQAWKIGAGYEFVRREDGLPGLRQAYGLRLAGAPKTMDLGLLYQALEKHQVDMAAGNSTDGLLAVLPVTVLKDDKHYFPPYECALVLREEAARRFPALRPALVELSGKISSDTMRRLNYELDGKHRPAREIARDFLKSVGLN